MPVILPAVLFPPSMMACCIPSLRWRVLNQWLPSSSSIQSASMHGRKRSVFMSVIRSLAYAGGQPSGAYSRQLWRRSPGNDCDDSDGNLDLISCLCWLLGDCWPGMVTPSMVPHSSIQSESGNGCPHATSIVRPSALLPARSCSPKCMRRASPDLSPDRRSPLLCRSVSDIRYMAQVGKTVSTITSIRAYGGNKISVVINTHIDIYTLITIFWFGEDLVICFPVSMKIGIHKGSYAIISCK